MTTDQMHNAARVLRAEIHHARGDGRTWQDIAATLGIENPGSVYEWAIGPRDRRHGARAAWWTRSTCGLHVIDHGPYSTNPADNEEEHAHGCARHRRELDAYQAH